MKPSFLANAKQHAPGDFLSYIPNPDRKIAVNSLLFGTGFEHAFEDVDPRNKVAKDR